MYVHVCGTFVCVCLTERQKNEPYLQIRFYGQLTVTVNGAALVKPTRITRKKLNTQEKERTRLIQVVPVVLLWCASHKKCRATNVDKM